MRGEQPGGKALADDRVVERGVGAPGHHDVGFAQDDLLAAKAIA